MEARLRVTVRGVVTTTLMVTHVATLKPTVPLGLLRVSLWCSHGLMCYVTPTFYKNKIFVQIGMHIKMHNEY
jgi:hypothetical protein